MSDAASVEFETYRATVAWDADRDDLRAHEACYVANSLNCPVEVEPR